MSFISENGPEEKPSSGHCFESNIDTPKSILHILGFPPDALCRCIKSLNARFISST